MTVLVDNKTPYCFKKEKEFDLSGVCKHCGFRGRCNPNAYYEVEEYGNK